MTMDLDRRTGSRVRIEGDPDTWVIFDGSRHRLKSTPTAERVFTQPAELVDAEALLDVPRGPDLAGDLCLIRREGEGAIYLVTGWGYEDITRRHITTWETFVAFGFDMDQVRDVPSIVFWAIRPGRDIRADAPAEQAPA